MLQIPPKLPPLEKNYTDTYDNVSTILTGTGDGDWQVGLDEEEEDLPSESSGSETGDIVDHSAVIHGAAELEVTAEVHHVQREVQDGAVPYYLQQGETSSPARDIDCLEYGDDTIPMMPLYSQVMTPHPPPYFTVQEMEQGYAKDDCFIVKEDTWYPEQGEVEDSLTLEEDYGYSEQEGYNACQEDQSNTVQDSYLQEFRDYYAQYEEGADHLYYESFGEDDEDPYGGDVGDPGGG